MFHKVTQVKTLPDFKLKIRFAEGETKQYDVKPLMAQWDIFAKFREDLELFNTVKVDIGGYGITWNEELDISCDELWINGVTQAPAEKTLPNHKKSGVWIWQLGIVVPDGTPAEYPTCPFCTTSPFQEFSKDIKLPGRCPECGAKLKLEK